MITLEEDRFQDIRKGVRATCDQFGEEYHQRVSRENKYPEEWVEALTKARWLSALIPTEYGGLGLGLAEASVIMEEINRSGGNSGNCHAQMYNMGTVLRHGSDAQKQLYLPRIASGDLRLQSMAVTEPETGTDTSKTRTTAVKKGDKFVVNGEKVWIGRIQHSDLIILLARTTPLEEVRKHSEGLSIFIFDLHQALGHGMEVKLIDNMVNAETNHVYFHNLEIPADSLIGEEGQGLKYIFDGLNAERILIAGECIGDGYWFLAHAIKRSKERVVFDRPIGQNQGIQFNMAKHLAAKASWEAANVCVQTFGGYAFDNSYGVERKFRQTRLYQVAPISTNLVLSYVGQHVLGMPRSF